MISELFLHNILGFLDPFKTDTNYNRFKNYVKGVII